MKKEKRTKMQKKLSVEEINLLLDYLKECEVLEAPTAQIFYQKFIDRTGVDATWDFLQFQVRHLKLTYERACSWRSSTAILAILKIKDELKKICPYFDQLDQIYGPKGTDNNAYVVAANECNTIEYIAAGSPEITIEDIKIEPYNSHETENVPFVDYNSGSPASPATSFTPPMNTAATDTAPRSTYTEKMQSNGLKRHSNALANLLEFQKERVDLQKQRLEIEEKRLRLEEKKLEENIKFKNQSLAQEKDLKILQLEKDERVAMFEIKSKYNIKE